MRQWLAAYCLSLAMVPWTNGFRQAQRGFPDGSPFPPERDGLMSQLKQTTVEDDPKKGLIVTNSRNGWLVSLGQVCCFFFLFSQS